MNWRKQLGKITSEKIKRCFYDEPFRHLYAVGPSGSGKTVFMHHILHELPFAYIIISPDGELAEKAYAPDCLYYSELNPINLNPLVYPIQDSRKANFLVEVLNTACKVGTDDKQMPMLVLMQRIMRNAVKTGITSLKELLLLCDSEDKRKAQSFMYWQKFDQRDKKGWYLDRERVDSIKRIAARLSWIVDDDNSYAFFKGKDKLDIKRIVNAGQKVIFNLKNFDLFNRSFIGGIILLYIFEYHFNATNNSKPLFVFVDEIHQFVSDKYYYAFPAFRKVNISMNISLHSFGQLEKQIVNAIDVNCYTQVNINPKFKALVKKGDEEYLIRLFKPLTHTPPQKFQFLKDAWINLL